MTAHDCDREQCEGPARRAHVEAMTQGLPAIATDRAAYGRLYDLIANSSTATPAVPDAAGLGSDESSATALASAGGPSNGQKRHPNVASSPPTSESDSASARTRRAV